LSTRATVNLTVYDRKNPTKNLGKRVRQNDAIRLRRKYTRTIARNSYGRFSNGFIRSQYISRVSTEKKKRRPYSLYEFSIKRFVFLRRPKITPIRIIRTVRIGVRIYIKCNNYQLPYTIYVRRLCSRVKYDVRL